MSIPGPSGATPDPIPNTGDLQFERAEYESGGPVCANCKRPASPEYHEFAGKIFCGACRHGIEASLANLRGSGNLMQAFLYGLGAAVLGSLIFYAVSALTGYQFGLIAVVVGWLVGKAVRKGSGGLGGRRYQIMAVLLTYASVASTHVPAITKYFDAQAAKAEQSSIGSGNQVSSETPARPVLHAGSVSFYAWVFALALALPLLNAKHDILGLVIIGIALWEAWKFTREVKVQFSGPFAVASSPGASGA